MRISKLWIFSGLIVAAIAGAGLFVATAPSRAQGPEAVELGDHWRHHDGRWSYYHAADKSWYYTDGQHWFTHNGKAWVPYRFDKTFGRNFERGTYVVPPVEGRTVVVPAHRVFVPR